MNDIIIPGKTDIAKPRDSYEDARRKAIAIASSAARNIASSIDYVAENKLGQPKIYFQYVEAYEMRLGAQAMDNGQARYHGLAYLEQDLEVAEKLMQKMVDLKTRAGDFEGSIAHEINIGKEYANTLRDFFSQYDTDIRAERLTDGYRLDKSIVAQTMADMKSASLGIWKAELVSVKNETTGHPQDLETPASASLSQIANLVRSHRLKLDLK